MLSLVVIKVIVLIVLFLLTFTLGFIPLKLIRYFHKRATSRNPNNQLTEIGRPDQESRPTYKRVISFLSCFAAGVFLATCFLDLLPEVRRELMNVLDVMKIYTGFPLAEFVTVIGLFAILITEQIVISVKERHSSRQGDRAPLLSGGGEDWQKSATESTRSEHSISGISDRPHIEHKKSEILQESESEEPASDQDLNYQRGHHRQQHEEHVHSHLRSFLLLVALSLHSIFEGLSVGLETEKGNVLGIFAGLVLHKSILSFSLGMNLVQTNLSSKLMLRSILFFSVIAPLGVGIGIGIIHLWDSTASSLVQGLLQGVACGTFLYITFFEVLPHEFNSHHDRLLKLLFLLLGYSTVTGILFLSGSTRKPFCPVVNPSVNGSTYG